MNVVTTPACAPTEFKVIDEVVVNFSSGRVGPRTPPHLSSRMLGIFAGMGGAPRALRMLRNTPDMSLRWSRGGRKFQSRRVKGDGEVNGRLD